MITLHNPHNTIVFSLDLASEIGDKEAMLLPKMAEWIEAGVIHGAEDKKTGKKYTQLITYEIDGELWRCIDLKSVRAGGFSFMSIATVSRKIASLVKQGLLKERTDLNKHPFDSSKWYTLDRDGINSLKSLFFTAPDPPNPKIPDNVEYQNGNRGSQNENYNIYNENYNIYNDSLKDLKIQDSESKQKNIKDSEEEKEPNLIRGDQVEGFSNQAEIGKTLLPAEDPRPTSPDERMACQRIWCEVMGIDWDVKELRKPANRVLDKYYPRYREWQIRDFQTYFRETWEYKAGTLYPDQRLIDKYLYKSYLWSLDGYPALDPSKKQHSDIDIDYADLIET